MIIKHITHDWGYHYVINVFVLSKHFIWIMVVNTLDNNWNFIEKCPIYPNFHYQKVKKKPENKNVYWAITTNNRVKWDYRWLLAVFLKQFYARYLSNKGIGFVIYCYHMMQMYLLSVLTFKVLWQFTSPCCLFSLVVVT